MLCCSLSERWVLLLQLSLRRRLCTASTLACADYTESPMLLGETSDTFQVNSQLKHLVKTGCLIDARILFEKMPYRDEITWTTIIAGYVKTTDTTEALRLFTRMWVEPRISMDPFVLSLALKICGLRQSERFGESLHGYLTKTDFGKSVFAGSALVDLYTKVGKIEEACKVFHEMPIRNVVTWTTIITGLARAGLNKEALVYFSEMWKSREWCDSFTFASVLKACANSGAFNYGREIHCQTMKRGLDETTFVANTLATMYNKCGKLEYGFRLFEKMSVRDVVSWTVLITEYTQTGQLENAIKALMRMQKEGVDPNEFTYAAVISGCASLGRIKWGEQLHTRVLHVGLADCSSVANSVLTMYAKHGLLTLASEVFERLKKRDIVTWSTIIAGYAQGGCAQEAFEYLSRMRKEGPAPNQFAFASVLGVSGEMAILEQGRQLHAHVLQVGLDQKEMIKSSLINMYSRCGSVKEASKVFEDSEKYDIVSWTTMIKGFAEHGYSQEAFDLFERLPAVGLKPDSVTFIGVLTACCHAGLVDLGFHYFNSMSKEFNIYPKKEHYGIMIDLLCRAGQLSEAESMIQSMPFQQDDVVWSSLLGACMVHGDVDRGTRAAEKILELHPESAGTHIALANIYAAKGKWREAADSRKKMRLKGVIKEPGQSWIKVKNETSVFVSGHWTHPHGEDIKRTLDLLLTSKGRVPAQ